MFKKYSVILFITSEKAGSRCIGVVAFPSVWIFVGHQVQICILKLLDSQQIMQGYWTGTKVP